ncbi:prepilin-type N-terminal cleavage/methylation domain-containing protein [Vibrio sp. Of14-4]|uniref:PilW family protein n=1 Tax=Vibrio sp. Of14-4 TaxID=2724878 RepID=UPI001EF2F707|nr:prepilin-type N-terminal cleavage/methylation domain-containing protein [Vibrio sp. Of14-4]MCG7489989.1 prepilin-type N-terminal cleavage/methylation domain-containing protein [Vibrio sp. Of14-4]
MLKPKSYYQGMSLVECLVSVAISLILMATLVSLLLHNAQITNSGIKQRLLQQSTHSVSQMIKHDLYRAGYGGELGQVIKISGADNVYHWLQNSANSLVSYAYLAGELGSKEAYVNVVYQRNNHYPNQLRVCEVKLPRVISVTEAANFNAYFGNRCNTLFDSKQIMVTAFELKSETIPSSSPSSTLLTVSITTALTDLPEQSLSVSFVLKPRNS